MKIAPATRSGGTSASVALSAENKRVPSVSPSAWPASTTRISMPGMRCRRWVTAARAASVWAARSPKFWLGLLSTTTTATEESGSRSSRVSDGFASASTSSARAAVRSRAPRLRETSIRRAIAAATAAAAHTYSVGMRGAKLIPKFTPVLLFCRRQACARAVSCPRLLAPAGSVPSPACGGGLGRGLLPQTQGLWPMPRPPLQLSPASGGESPSYCPSRSSSAGTWTWSAL